MKGLDGMGGMMFPKQKPKKKKMKHPASIMHNKEDRTCYLCMIQEKNYNRYNYLEEHHIFGGPNRKKSEEYGLKVYLCLRHHREGKHAVHNNHENMRLLQREGQQAFQVVYPDLDFGQVFKTNYL